MLTVVAYDIRDNRSRSRIHRLLKEYGLPTQLSVFECELDAETVSRLTQRLCALLDADSDSLRIYGVCERCARKVMVQGLGIRVLPRTFEIV